MENSGIAFSVLTYEGLDESLCVFLWLMTPTSQMTKVGFASASCSVVTSELLLPLLLVNNQEEQVHLEPLV